MNERMNDWNQMQPASPEAIHWYVVPVLLVPGRVRQGLERVRASGRFERVPNLWQLSLGVLRMWYQMIFHPEIVGMGDAEAVRPTFRARLMHFRPVRLPFLLAERVITPLELTGLASSRQRTIRHLLGAYHDRRQFAYDLELLACDPGALEELRARVCELIENDTPRNRWLRDLVVFDGYHQRLLEAVEAALAGRFGLHEDEERDPYVSFSAYLRWCAAQPETPGATLHAFRAGKFDLERGLVTESARADRP